MINQGVHEKCVGLRSQIPQGLSINCDRQNWPFLTPPLPHVTDLVKISINFNPKSYYKASWTCYQLCLSFMSCHYVFGVCPKKHNDNTWSDPPSSPPASIIHRQPHPWHKYYPGDSFSRIFLQYEIFYALMSQILLFTGFRFKKV